MIPYLLKYAPIKAKWNLHGTYDISCKILAWHDAIMMTPNRLRAYSSKIDRYALRTASQWVGPQMEDFLLAHKQVTIEMNSSTDNALINEAAQRVHHGGNFQAVSLTLAMEKARLALQNPDVRQDAFRPMLHNELPPNLTADNLSLSFHNAGCRHRYYNFLFVKCWA